MCVCVCVFVCVCACVCVVYKVRSSSKTCTTSHIYTYIQIYKKDRAQRRARHRIYIHIYTCIGKIELEFVHDIAYIYVYTYIQERSSSKTCTTSQRPSAPPGLFFPPIGLFSPFTRSFCIPRHRQGPQHHQVPSSRPLLPSPAISSFLSPVETVLEQVGKHGLQCREQILSEHVTNSKGSHHQILHTIKWCRVRSW